MKEQIPQPLFQFLQSTGIPDKTLKNSDLDTRLYHDLGLYGDTAHWFVEELSKRADMTGFRFERHFPPEFYGEHIVERIFFWLCPFAAAIRQRKTNYAPVTLGMISKSLETGKWVDLQE